MNVKNLILAILLTMFVMLLSYLSSKSIEKIVEEKTQEIKETERNKIINNSSFDIEISEDVTLINKSREKNDTSKFSIGSYEKITNIEENIQNKTKIINYTKFEEAYIYDLCYADEILSIEGRNLICLNEIPRIIRISLNEDIVKLVYNDLLIREEQKNKRILIGYAFAKDFYGVEGEIIEFFTNSTFISIENFDLGEISYLNEKIIYASFPIYIDIENIKDDVINIFVKTSIKNYLISSIKILKA